MRTFLFSLKITRPCKYIFLYQNGRTTDINLRDGDLCAVENEKFGAFFSDMDISTTISVHVVMAITLAVSVQKLLKC